MLVIVAEAFFVTMGALVKLATETLPNETVVFFRNVFGLVALFPIVAYRGQRDLLSTTVPHLHLLRGVAGVSAMYCFFYALAHLPLAEAQLLKLSAPLFVPLIALAWLGESIRASTRWALAIGFCGVVLILNPVVSLHLAALVGLLGGLLAALAKVTVRRLSRTEPTARIVFYFGVVATSISTIPMLFHWQAPTLTEWLLLALIGGMATLGQLALTRAYGLGRAAEIGGLTYVSVLLAALFGWVFWDEVLTPYAVAGALLIILSGLVMLYAGSWIALLKRRLAGSLGDSA